MIRAVFSGNGASGPISRGMASDTAGGGDGLASVRAGVGDDTAEGVGVVSAGSPSPQAAKRSAAANAAMAKRTKAGLRNAPSSSATICKTPRKRREIRAGASWDQLTPITPVTLRPIVDYSGRQAYDWPYDERTLLRRHRSQQALRALEVPAEGPHRAVHGGRRERPPLAQRPLALGPARGAALDPRPCRH